MWKLGVFSVIFLHVIVAPFSYASTQEFTFYKNSSCTGENHTVYNTVDNIIHQNSWITNASSIFMQGLWGLTCSTAVDGGGLRYGFHVVYYGDPPTGRCVDRSEFPIADPSKYDIEYLERYGPSEMTTNQISVFTEKTFQGLSYTVVGKDAEPSPRPFAMESIIISGNESWLIYPQQGFRGSPKCLCPERNRQDGLNFSVSTTIIFGSAMPATDACDCLNTSGVGSSYINNLMAVFALSINLLLKY